MTTMAIKTRFTPKGTFVYPKLNAPDTKFKTEGEYSVKLRMSSEDFEQFKAFYLAEKGKHFEATNEELKKRLANAKTGTEKAKAKKELDSLEAAVDPFRPVFDEEGNETGQYDVNFKMPAQVISQKDGSVISLKPGIFDSKGRKLENPPQIWGGTEGIVAYEMRPFYKPVSGCGISLRLKAVQIIKLVEGGQGGDVVFPEQDGYVASEEDSQEGFADRGGSDINASEAEDF